MHTQMSNVTSDTLYTVEQTRALDRFAIEQELIPATVLMERAGQAAFNCLVERWPQSRDVVVVCGSGNNAGDGYVVARLAKECGVRVKVLQLGSTVSLSDAARQMLEALETVGITPQPFDSQTISQADVIVDAIFGIGLRREVSGDWKQAIDAINDARVPRLSVDIPSGLNADTGQPMGVAVRADVTATFIGRKQGCYTGQGRDYCGDIEFFDLAIPRSVYEHVKASTKVVARASMASWLGTRSRGAHKGHFGHALLVGGDHGMNGAIRLAAESALRCGAGWVSVATRPEHALWINAAQPEMMVRGVKTGAELAALLEKASVIGVGPGLGIGPWSLDVWQTVLSANRPMVVDADALNLLAQNPCRRAEWILTPHPGEAARLLQTTVAAIENDRFAAATEIQRRFGGVCVLKGAGTIVCGDQSPVYVCTMGNPGMASGGMGDVLTGIIAGVWAQASKLNKNIVDIAVQSVALHAQAGDNAAAQGERGMVASDLIAHIRHLMNEG